MQAKRNIRLKDAKLYKGDTDIRINDCNKCKEVDGLVLEAENFSDLTLEVKEAITTLMTLNKQNPVHNADLIYKSHIALA